MNFCAAQSLRHLQQHRPFLQGQVARAGLETEECLCANSREGIILKEQFGSRFLPCLEAEVVLNYVSHCSRAATVLRVDHADLVNDLCDFGLGQRTRERLMIEKNRRGDDGSGREENSEHRRAVLIITIITRRYSTRILR